MWDVINGVVSDDPVEELDKVYDWAKLQVALFNYRKLFGLSYEEVLKEPLEEFVINAKIEELMSIKREQEIKRGD